MELAIRLDQPPEVYDALMDEAASVASRYQALWEVLHAEPTFSFDDRYPDRRPDPPPARPHRPRRRRGQARILLGDLRAYQARHARAGAGDSAIALQWVNEVLRPGMARAHQAVEGLGDAVQAYCDLLEVRWLLSEQAGHDVGDMAALEALARRSVPSQSAAEMAIAEATTGQFAALTPQLLASLTTDAETYPEPDEP